MIATTSQDCLIVMFDQVRTQRPAIYLCDEWSAWLCAIGDCISALKTSRQRWSAGVLVANDICQSIPGMPLAAAHMVILEAVMKSGGVEKVR